MKTGSLYRLKASHGRKLSHRRGIIARPIPEGPVHWLPYNTICMFIESESPVSNDYSEEYDLFHDYARNHTVLVGEQLFRISDRDVIFSPIEENSVE